MKKNLILLFGLLTMASMSLAQRTKDEIRIIHPLLESVPLDEIRDFKRYQEQHFKNPRARLAGWIINENTHNQYYNLIGTHDIVGIGTILNEQSTQDWESHVKAHAGMCSGEQPYSIESLDLKDAQGAILVVKEPIRIVDYFYYQNKQLGVTLLFAYVSNKSFEERLENMRNILRNLKVESR